MYVYVDVYTYMSMCMYSMGRCWYVSVTEKGYRNRHQIVAYVFYTSCF